MVVLLPKQTQLCCTGRKTRSQGDTRLPVTLLSGFLGAGGQLTHLALKRLAQVPYHHPLLVPLRLVLLVCPGIPVR